MSRTRTDGKSLPQATRGLRSGRGGSGAGKPGHSAGAEVAEICRVALHGHG